jgi:hypothetical protein
MKVLKNIRNIRNKRKCRELEKLHILLHSDKYKNSHYIIQKINDGYGIKNTKNNKYKDLLNLRYQHYKGSEYFLNCIVSLKNVLFVYENYCEPNIHELIIINTVGKNEKL